MIYYHEMYKDRSLSSETSPRKKGGKKRNPWSSDEESDKEGFSSDEDDDIKSDVVIPRDTGRRAAGKLHALHKPCLSLITLHLSFVMLQY